MSRSAGPGSPLTLKCHHCRRRWPPGSKASRGELTRTGRERGRRCKHGSALGLRNLLRLYECRCSLCGHLGWYSHNGVLQLPIDGGHGQ